MLFHQIKSDILPTYVVGKWLVRACSTVLNDLESQIPQSDQYHLPQRKVSRFTHPAASVHVCLKHNRVGADTPRRYQPISKLVINVIRIVTGGLKIIGTFHSACWKIG
jgi:hypothetical protein